MPAGRTATLVRNATLVLLALAAVAALAATAASVEAKLVKPYPEPLRKATGKLGAEETKDPVRFIVLDRSAILEHEGSVYIDSTKGYPLQLRSVIFGLVPAAAGLAAVAAVAAIAARRGRGSADGQ